MKQALERLLNELPIIAAGVAAVLHVLGVDTDPEDVNEVVRALQAVVGLFVMWHIRRNVNGPVTLHRLYAHGDEHDAEGDLE